MSRWVCPRCDREFGRTNQGHTCVPGCTVDEVFVGHPQQRPTYDALERFVATLGEVHLDPVSVGVFLKSDRKFAEVRPKHRWLSLELALPARIEHDRVSRRMGNVHVVRLYSPDDVDDLVCAWTSQAYLYATD